MFEELSSKDPKVKYGAAKSLLATAAAHPASLYPHIEFFEKLLGSDNNILKWTAINVIGKLASLDEEKKARGMTAKLTSLLAAGKMITANHAISALAEFAKAFPEHREAITEELLRVEHYTYDTEECRNIAMGNVIVAIGSYFPSLQGKQSVLQFAQRQTQNTRHATAKKAQAFLKKYTIS